MSPEELIAALDDRIARSEELLRDMRTMDKTLRATLRSAEVEIKKIFNAITDEMIIPVAKHHTAEVIKHFKIVQERLERNLERMCGQLVNMMDAPTRASLNETMGELGIGLDDLGRPQRLKRKGR